MLIQFQIYVYYNVLNYIMQILYYLFVVRIVQVNFIIEICKIENVFKFVNQDILLIKFHKIVRNNVAKDIMLIKLQTYAFKIVHKDISLMINCKNALVVVH